MHHGLRGMDAPARQQRFRAMIGSHLARPIRGEPGYAQLGPAGLPPNFSSPIRATLGERQIRPSPGLDLNRNTHSDDSGNDWVQLSVLTESSVEFLGPTSPRHSQFWNQDPRHPSFQASLKHTTYFFILLQSCRTFTPLGLLAILRVRSSGYSA